MTNKKYHYTVSRASWAYSDDQFTQLMRWARETQTGFYWNHMSRPFEMFAFWAYPKDVQDVFEEAGMSTHMNLKIDVGNYGLPEEL